MHLSSFVVRNFRRLKQVKIDTSDDTTILVGANNSGKTSATHVFQLFLNDTAKFSIHDFSADCWGEFNQFDPTANGTAASLPVVSLDLWFSVDDDNVHRVIDILPDLEWQGKEVGVRVAFEPIDHNALFSNYRDAYEAATKERGNGAESYRPWPRNLHDYLSKRLNQEYRLRYYKLDVDKFTESGIEAPGYLPSQLDSGAKVVASLIRVDFLDAQRYLADVEARGRAEDLSKRMSRFYQRNLQKRDPDLDALRALAESETKLNAHFADVFKPTLESLRQLGYPGLTNPELIIRTELKADTILSGSAQVHYVVGGTQSVPTGGPDATLPDRYNGLGFKNLIYMVVEILDYHHAWMDAETSRPPVHLIMIEEPESHLHAQLQQVFIRQIRQIVGDTLDGVGTQFIITTHSSHVVYEDFRSIRYFGRLDQAHGFHFTEVRNLSTFYNNEEPATRNFLLQYLRLTHCDLFFADAAVLVEGNVERLLLPMIISRTCSELEACHLTILEVGGAFAHKFRDLVEFLGLTTLVITDLDSVVAEKKDQNNAEGDHNSEAKVTATRAKSCLASAPGAITSNPILKEWVPGLTSVKDLLDVDSTKKVADMGGKPKSAVRVAYQTLRPVSWQGTNGTAAGRTLEEAFAFENLEWCQDPANQALGLLLSDDVRQKGLVAVLEGIFEKVRTIDKTQFALALIGSDQNSWIAPTYIVEGLEWLAEQLGVREVPQTATTEGGDAIELQG